MSAQRRAADPKVDFDARIVRLIEMASEPRPVDVVELGRIAYETFCTSVAPAPMIPNLRPHLFVSFETAQLLESIVMRALEDRFPSPRAFADALSQAFGPYLVQTRLETEELILCDIRSNVPFPAILAADGVHAIDLLIEDPDRRIVARTCPDSIRLLEALRDCRLRRAPILVDHESARFPHPDFVRYRPITNHDVEVLQALCPLARIDAELSAS